MKLPGDTVEENDERRTEIHLYYVIKGEKKAGQLVADTDVVGVKKQLRTLIDPG